MTRRSKFHDPGDESSLDSSISKGYRMKGVVSVGRSGIATNSAPLNRWDKGREHKD
jgi:hypothetical protein